MKLDTQPTWSKENSLHELDWTAFDDVKLEELTRSKGNSICKVLWTFYMENVWCSTWRNCNILHGGSWIFYMWKVEHSSWEKLNILHGESWTFSMREVEHSTCRKLNILHGGSWTFHMEEVEHFTWKKLHISHGRSWTFTWKKLHIPHGKSWTFYIPLIWIWQPTSTVVFILVIFSGYLPSLYISLSLWTWVTWSVIFISTRWLLGWWKYPLYSWCSGQCHVLDARSLLPSVSL